MRCMTCGDDMVLIEAMPAEMGGVQGFEMQTHHCPACRGTERRFIFVRRKTDFVERRVKTATRACAAHEVKVSHHVNGADKTAVHPRSSIKLFAVPPKGKSGAGHDRLIAPSSVTETTLPVSEPLTEKITQLDHAPGEVWVRAVEKFRRYEADLHQRVEKSKKTNGNIEAGKGSGRLTIPRYGERRVANKSDETTVGEPLRRRTLRAGPLERPHPEALRCFDEFWDNLVPPRSAKKPTELSVTPSSLAPLPQSLSLVVIEPTAIPASKIRAKLVFKKMLEKVLQCLEGHRVLGAACTLGSARRQPGLCEMNATESYPGPRLV
jgi:hypothetical protein